jgi:hypothetical protein
MMESRNEKHCILNEIYRSQAAKGSSLENLTQIAQNCAAGNGAVTPVICIRPTRIACVKLFYKTSGYLATI